MPTPPAAPTEPAGCRAIAWPFAVVLLLVLIIAAVTAVMIARDPGAFVASVWVEQIGKTSVPDEQKQRMVTVIHDVRDRVEAQQITPEQAAAVARAIATDHATHAALYYYVAERVQRGVPEPTHDAEALTRLHRRLVRGVAEGTIDGAVINELAPRVSRHGRPRDDVSAAQVAALEKRVRAIVEAAGVPDEPYDVDAAALFERAVRDALAK
jgi:hypothetical protein